MKSFNQPGSSNNDLKLDKNSKTPGCSSKLPKIIRRLHRSQVSDEDSKSTSSSNRDEEQRGYYWNAEPFNIESGIEVSSQSLNRSCSKFKCDNTSANLLSASASAPWIKQEHKSCQTSQTVFSLIDEADRLEVLSQCDSCNSDESFGNEFESAIDSESTRMENSSMSPQLLNKDYKIKYPLSTENFSNFNSSEESNALCRLFHSSADLAKHRSTNEYGTQNESASVTSLNEQKHNSHNSDQLHSKSSSAPVLIRAAPNHLQLTSLSVSTVVN